MTLTKSQRASIREMFGGRCAYCGHELGPRWHADHVIAVERKTHYVRDKNDMWKAKTIGFWAPHNDHKDNIFPACAPCNIHKSCSSLEDWRKQLQDQINVALRGSSPLRHAMRFGMLEIAEAPIVFYFEKVQGGTN